MADNGSGYIFAIETKNNNKKIYDYENKCNKQKNNC